MHLCNRLLHDYRGATLSGLWRTSRTLRAESGTRSRRSNTAGAATSFHQIESNLYERQGKGLTNFSRTHLRLRCFVVIDLKIEEFKPEFVSGVVLCTGQRSTRQTTFDEPAASIVF